MEDAVVAAAVVGDGSPLVNASEKHSGAFENPDSRAVVLCSGGFETDLALGPF